MSMGWMHAFNEALVRYKHKPAWTLEQAEKELRVIPENCISAEEFDLIIRLYKAEDDKEIATEALQSVIGSYWCWVNSDR